VHIAPGHGQEDYELGLRHGLEIYAPVDSSGRFTKDVPEFEGTPVFKANAAIIELLRNNNALIGKEDIRHSYPHCWRCKSPVIFRATEQWFASMEAGEAGPLRQNALKAIEKDIQWIPSWGKERIYNMVAGRPDWCLSRQRAWGVPIPAIRCIECGISRLDGALIEKLADDFEENGADVWFEKPLNEIMPQGTRCLRCGSERLEKEDDILDVWFDSGVSFAAVLEKRQNLGFPAGLYLEGSDQHRGWFHSSLLACMGTRKMAPYRAVLTHGFVVDGEGRKMSKSTGNVIAPHEVMDKYGAEVLRLWVAAEDYREDVRISEEILKRLSEAYRRIRNTFRFILGNLYDFDPEKDIVRHDALCELDRLALHRLFRLNERVISAYGDFEFHAVYHSVHNFCAVDLSAFYLDIIKDRLYTSKAASPERRAAQTTLYHALNCLLRLVAPVLAFTADEAWAFMPGKKEESVHLSAMPLLPAIWRDDRLSEMFDRLLSVKAEAAKALEGARQARLIGHSLDASVVIYPPQDLQALLKEKEALLKEVLIVSGLKVMDSVSMVDSSTGGGMTHIYGSTEIKGITVLVEKAQGLKCERCWHLTAEAGQSGAHPSLCPRCAEALR
ncbi:MAG: class I tRNA ligase family protein, partial [Deltaproteobacteria bacterium]